MYQDSDFTRIEKRLDKEARRKWGLNSDRYQEYQPTLSQEAEKEFRKRYPEKAKTYDLREKGEIYERPEDDPIYRHHQREITRQTNLAIQGRKDLTSVWRKIQHRIAIQQWQTFAVLYPVKTVAYAPKNPYLQQALIRPQTPPPEPVVTGEPPPPPDARMAAFRYEKKIPVLREIKETPVQIPSGVKRVIDRATPDTALLDRYHPLARKVAVGEIKRIIDGLPQILKETQRTGQSPEEAIRTQVVLAGLKANLQLEKGDIETLVNEISRPIKKTMARLAQEKLPARVKRKLQAEREKARRVKRFVPLPDRLRTRLRSLSPSGQALIAMERLISGSEEFGPGHLDPSFRLMSHGILPPDIRQTLSALRDAGLQKGHPIYDQFTQLYNQLQNFYRAHPRIAAALEKAHGPMRQAGRTLEEIEAIREKFRLPVLETALRPIEIGKMRFRNLLGEKIAKPLGLVQRGLVKRVDLGAGKFAYESAVKEFLAKKIRPIVEKQLARLAKTAAGQAVLTFAKETVKPALKKAGKAAVKVAAKLAVKIAAKLGIELSASAIMAAIPGLQPVAAIATVYSIYDTLLDLIEAIPVIGKPLALLIDLINPVGWVRRGIRLVGGFLTFRYLREGMREGGMRGSLKAATNVIIVGLPLLAGALSILGPGGILIFLGGGALVIGGTFLITQVVTAVPQIAAGISTALPSAVYALIAFLTAPVSVPAMVIAGIVVVLVLVVVFLAIFIVVLIAGGAFLVTPYQLAADFGESEYIDVVKTVNGVNYLEIPNPTAPVELSYRIEITATGYKLENVQVSNDTYIRKPEPEPGDPSQFAITTDKDGNSITGWNIDGIEANQTHTIEYVISLDPDHIEGMLSFTQIHDSWLIDTVQVTADVPDEGLTGERETQQAKVKIGDPPTLGPEGWPTTGGITQLPRTPGGTHDSNSSVPNSIDIANEFWTPVFATHEGIAHVPDFDRFGYGHWLIICSLDGCSGSDGWQTRYAHFMDAPEVEDGQHVAPCELIGYMGNTGYVIGDPGTHLHYELRGDPGLGPDILDYVPNGHSVDVGDWVSDVCTGGPPAATPTPRPPLYLPTAEPTDAPSPISSPPAGYYSCRIIYDVCQLYEENCNPDQTLPPDPCDRPAACTTEPITLHWCGDSS